MLASHPHRRSFRSGQFWLFVTLFLFCAGLATACPFCTAFPRTISDDVEDSTAAVIARCEDVSERPDGLLIARVRITDVVKGSPELKHSVVEVASARQYPKDTLLFLLGFGETDLLWDPPKEISPKSVTFLRGLGSLPERGPKRLAYFLEYLPHPEELVAADAYNEFAEATMEEIAALKDQLDRQWVIDQLRDSSVPVHRRRLCWTLLSHCGLEEDARLFGEAIKKRIADPTFDPGMDAGIACYLSLGGTEALARIEKGILANPYGSYTDCFSAVKAIRVHGTELDVIPRERLAAALRHILARPDLADLVISDLARWGDWTAIDRIVELFETATEETQLLKPAAVLYLKKCPLPAGKQALDRLRKSDPEAVKLAESSMLFYPGLASVPVPPPVADDSDDAPEETTPVVADNPPIGSDAEGSRRE